MSKKVELDSVYGNKFLFRIEDKDSISVLSAGYAITPKGEFVNVLDDEDHSNVFSNYLRDYLEKPDREEEDSLHAMISLTKLHHVAYSGIKLGDNIREGNVNQGYALLVFPDDLSVLTDEQKESCLEFFGTNKSLFGNRKKVELQIHNFKGEQFTEEELTKKFQEELESKRSKAI